MSDLITSDHPLSEDQQAVLTALLNTLVPPGENRPGGGEMDLVAWLGDKAAELILPLKDLLDGFDRTFTTLDIEERVPLVQVIADRHPELFQGLLFHTYACYYQDDRVMTAIGLAPGPLFPRGHTVEQGDLSLLDPVLEVPRGYRRT